MWGTTSFCDELTDDFGGAFEATSIDGCRLFCRLAEIWPHGVLGLLQHYLPIPEVTDESATNGQARDDHAASLLTLDLIRAADDAPSSDSPYPTSRTMRSFNG